MARILTKVTEDGDLYTRPRQIELKIDAMLKLTDKKLSNQLDIGDPKSTAFLPSECLVYLIRDALRNGDNTKLNLILPVLLLRCERILIRKIQDQRITDKASLREDILCEFSGLFASDMNDKKVSKLDIFECRFNKAFKAFRLDKVEKELNRINNFMDLPQSYNHDNKELDDDILQHLSQAAKVPPNQESVLFMKDLLNEIKRLPPDVMKAVTLRYVIGFQIESNDPDETTVATICGCSSRTIRNRLKTAKTLLAHLMEDV